MNTAQPKGYDFVLENIYRLNRYSGNDKMDNSKIITYGFSAFTKNIKSNLSQSYEITNNSNFHNEQGNENNLSDLLGSIEYYKNNEISYNFRYDLNDSYLKKQSIDYRSSSKYGDINVSYFDQNTEINNIVNIFIWN